MLATAFALYSIGRAIEAIRAHNKQYKQELKQNFMKTSDELAVESAQSGGLILPRASQTSTDSEEEQQAEVRARRIYAHPVVMYFRVMGKGFGGVNGLLINSVICTGFALAGINALLTLFFGSGAAIVSTGGPFTLYAVLSVAFGLAGGIQSYRFTGDSIRRIWEAVGRSIAVHMVDEQALFCRALSNKIFKRNSIYITMMMAAAVGTSSALISADGVMTLLPAGGAAPQVIYWIVFCFTLMAAGLLFGNFFHKVLTGMLLTFGKESNAAQRQQSRNQMVKIASIMLVSTALAVGLFTMIASPWVPIIALGGGLGGAFVLCMISAFCSNEEFLERFWKDFGMIGAFVGASTLGISTFLFMSAIIASMLGVILGVTLGVMATTVLGALYYTEVVAVEKRVNVQELQEAAQAVPAAPPGRERRGSLPSTPPATPPESAAESSSDDEERTLGRAAAPKAELPVVPPAPPAPPAKKPVNKGSEQEGQRPASG